MIFFVIFAMKEWSNPKMNDFIIPFYLDGEGGAGVQNAKNAVSGFWHANSFYPNFHQNRLWNSSKPKKLQFGPGY